MKIIKTVTMITLTKLLLFLEVIMPLSLFQFGVRATPEIEIMIRASVEQEDSDASVPDCDPGFLLNISVITDYWAPWETKWYLKDRGGNMILERKPQNSDPDFVYVDFVCLGNYTDQCFVFGITDEAGDGLCIPTYDEVTGEKINEECGSYNVTLGNTLVVGGGDLFFHKDESDICTGSATSSPSDLPSMPPSHGPTITAPPTPVLSQYPTWAPSNTPTFPPFISADCGVDEGRFQILLQTDYYGYETSFSVKALESGEALVEFGHYSFLSLTLYWIPSKANFMCLPEGCYTFTITDDYGDGICNPSFLEHHRGYYELFLDDSRFHSGCDFDSGEEMSFCVGPNFSLAPTETLSQSPTLTPTYPPTFPPNELFSPECELDEGSFQLHFQTDEFGFETGWSLISQGSGGTLIQHGYDPSGESSIIFEPMQNYWIPSKTDFVCLPKGCYTFKIFDAFGDGLCNFNLSSQGFYELYLNGSLIDSGCRFRKEDKKFFCVGSEHTAQPTDSAAPSYASTSFLGTFFPTDFSTFLSSSFETSLMQNDDWESGDDDVAQDELNDVPRLYPSVSPSRTPSNMPTPTPSSAPSVVPTSFCVDREDLAYKNKEDQNCRWVGGFVSVRKFGKTTKKSKKSKKTKKTKSNKADDNETNVNPDEEDRIKTTRKRCKKTWQGQKLFDWCRKTCGDVGRGPCKA